MSLSFGVELLGALTSADPQVHWHNSHEGTNRTRPTQCSARFLGCGSLPKGETHGTARSNPVGLRRTLILIISARSTWLLPRLSLAQPGHRHPPVPSAKALGPADLARALWRHLGEREQNQHLCAWLVELSDIGRTPRGVHVFYRATKAFCSWFEAESAMEIGPIQRSRRRLWRSLHGERRRDAGGRLLCPA